MHNRTLPTNRLLNGLKLLAALPPVGITWLIYLSRWQWFDLLHHPKRIRHDPLLIFILLLMGVTGLNLDHHDNCSVWLSLLLLFVLLNLWLLCQQTATALPLPALRRFMIQFGLYITISGNVFHWLNSWLPLPTGIKFMLGDLLWGYAANHNRLFGSAYNPNDACCLLLIALGLFLAELTNQVQTSPTALGPRLRHGAVVLILTFGIYQTKSRTGLMILFGLLAYTAYHCYQNHRIYLTILITSCAPLVWFSLARHHTVTASLQTRLTIWHNSFDLFKQAPLLGVTYFGFAGRYLKLTGTYVPHAHDIFLMLLASFGILGGLGFVILVIMSVWHLTRDWHAYRHPDLRYFMLTLPIIFAYGLTDFVLSSLQVLIVILLLLAYWRQAQRHPQRLTPITLAK